MAADSFVAIQRQFTRYLRDPANAPVPAGADPRRMRVYAAHYRMKMGRVLRARLPALVAVLGEEDFASLIDEYAKLPRLSISRAPTFEHAFLDFLRAECADRPGLAPCVPELADYLTAVTALLLTEAAPDESDTHGEGDLLEGVPVFSANAELLRFEWPVHRIGADCKPETKPPRPTWLILYRKRSGDCGYVELNGAAAEIARRVRDNAAGKTGRELLTDPLAGGAGLFGGARFEDGAGILRLLRDRGVICGARPPGHERV